ncbi:MAG: BT4734/BF3469 family protein [Parabacteroides merdae]
MVDIDGIPEEIFDETLERVRADPHSFLAYKTLSGRGIRVIAWMEGEVTEENFPAAWQTVNAYYARLTGIAIDRQCKNATRMSVICHDPDALYRPDAERMKFASYPTPRPDKNRTSPQERNTEGGKHRPHAPRTPYAGLWKKRAYTTQPAATTTTSAGAST